MFMDMNPNELDLLRLMLKKTGVGEVIALVIYKPDHEVYFFIITTS